LKEAEMMADCKITRVYTGITGSHIRGQNSTGMVIVRDKEVTPVDVTRVVETAKAINIPNDQRLLLVEPQEVVIDSHEAKEPIGMSGGRLEVKVHIVTGAQSAAENIVKCVRRCGLEVEQLVLKPSASLADRHVGRPPRGQGAHRHRRAERGREHRQVRAPLRPGGRAAGAQAERVSSGAACRAAASRSRCTSSPARRARPRTSSSACAAAAWRSSSWCSTRARL